jgi:predicted tellurium resistance membrane protein TerC
MAWLTDPNAWIALLTLTVLEIVLGIDNIIFISILVGRLPKERQARGRNLGLALAMVMRIGLLFSIAWIARLTNPWFEILAHPFSGRDLILLTGGLFLLYKSTHEIHNKLEGEDEDGMGSGKGRPSFAGVLAQIMVLDLVFSLDSVITAVGMAEHLGVMVTAVVLAVGVMLLAAGWISDFVSRHPTVKMLALSFLLLVGMSLVAEGFGHHVPKGYVYFAMGFSIFVEALNLRLRKSRSPLHLKGDPGHPHQEQAGA